MVARRNAFPLFGRPLLIVGFLQMWRRQIHKASLLVGILLVAWPLWRAVWKGKRCIRCEMSLMAPEYEELGHLITSNQGHKYRFFRYHDFSLPDSHRNSNPRCTPVLFVPGNSGSYRQVRSFASQLLRDSMQTSPSSQSPPSSPCYNVYAVDFREEFVAFSAHLLLHQIEYVQRVVQHLCQEHLQMASLVLVGHSYGGMVLRSAKLGQIAQDREILLVTLVSPHLKAPFTASRELWRLYAELSQAPDHRPSIISIGAGETDTLVHPELSRVPQQGSKVFYQRVDRLAGNWADPTHDAIAWERGLLRLLSRAILQFGSDPKEFERRIPEMMLRGDGGPEQEWTLECPITPNLTSGIYHRQDLCGSSAAPHVCLGYESASGLVLAFDQDLPLKISLNRTKRELIQTRYPDESLRLINQVGGQTNLVRKRLQYVVEGPTRASVLVRCSEEPEGLYAMPKSEWNSLINDGTREFASAMAQLRLDLHQGCAMRRESLDLGWKGMRMEELGL